MILAFRHKADKIFVEVETDFCTAFYLSGAEDRITGEVWLFNIGDTPIYPPWVGSHNWERPYQNSSEYCYSHTIQTPIHESDFEVDFHPTNKTAGIYFRDHLIGILADH